MLALHSPYVSTQFNGQPPSIINFECRHCEQRFSYNTLGMAVFLYGVFFLTGKNSQYAGITCPKCLNSILFDISGRLDEFFNTFNLFETPEGKTIVCDLKYYSPASCLAYQKCLLDGFDTVAFRALLSDVSKENYHGMLSGFMSQYPSLEKEYFCSFIWGTSSPIGKLSSVYWYRQDEIEAFLSIENECKVKIFPRYYSNFYFYETLEPFCWEHYLVEEFSEINEAMDLVRYEKDLTVTSTFLEILLSDYNFSRISDSGIEILSMIEKNDAPFEGIGFTEDWSDIDFIKNRNTFNEKNRSRMIAELEILIDRNYVHQYLNDNYFRFIHDYIDLSARTDFSYGTFRNLQMQYLTELYEFAHKQSLNDEQYAFFPEGDTWTIIFEGKALRKLSGGGFKYLHRLVSCPGRHFYTVDLDDTTEDPYKPSDGTHSGSTTAASYEEDSDNNDASTYDDDQSEEDGTGSKNINDMDEDGFEDGNVFEGNGFHDSNEKDKQKIDSNGAIWISQGKTFERNNLGPVLDKKSMPEVEKFRKELLKAIEDAERSKDEKRKTDAIKKFMLFKKELFKYTKGPKNHFVNATEKESNRISQAIRRAVIEIRGKANSPKRELREKVYNHFYLALNFIKTGSQMYMPIEDIKWKIK